MVDDEVDFKIKSKQDMRDFLSQDLKSRGLNSLPYFFALRKPIVLFLVWLRKAEYLSNTKKTPLDEILFQWTAWRLKWLSALLGFTIPLNTCGPGFHPVHWGSIVISSQARIGRNCRIHSCVNIGAYGTGAPIIGDNVYIGPGAKIFGDVTIGSNVRIGANAVVNKSFPDDVTLVGVPAKVVKTSRFDAVNL